MSKRSRFVLLSMLSLFVVIMVASIAIASDHSSNVPYQYPVIPGTEEWAELPDLEAKIDACSVDEALLENMTTPALAETVLTYPLLPNVYAFDTFQMGLASVSEYFPGIEELLNRPDAATCIEEFLVSLPAPASVDNVCTEVQIYLAQDLFEFLSDSSNESGVSPNYVNTVVYTPNETPVSAYKDWTWSDHGITQAQANAQSQLLELMYSTANQERSPFPSHNCHSYAWHSSSASNPYWINDPSAYMEDGSYSQSSNVYFGHRVYWSNGSHSAIVAAFSDDYVYVRSKWGALGTFYHRVDDCPYTGSVTYWD